MKRTSFILIVILFAISLALIPRGAVFGQQSPDVETSELKKTIEILENPEETKKLAERLKTLLKAQEKKEDRKPARSAQIPSNLFKAYQSLRQRAQALYWEVVAELENLPVTSVGLTAYLASEEKREELLSLIIKLVAALLVAFVAVMGIRMLTARFERRIDLREPFTLRKRISLALLSSILKIYPWVFLLVFSHFFVTILAVSEQTKASIQYVVLAVVVYYALKKLAYFFLLPQTPERRTIPVDDELARQIYTWSKRLLLFSLWMYLLIIPSAFYGRPALESAFTGTLRIGWFIFLSVLLVQWRESIGTRLCVLPRDDEPYYRRSFKVTCNHVARKLYLIAIFYIGLILILPVLGFPYLFTQIIYATAESFLILIVASGIVLAWNQLFRKLIRLSETLRITHADLEPHVSRYIAFLRKVGNIVVVFFAVLTILNIWGLRTYEFLQSNATILRPAARIPIIIIFAIFLNNVKDLLIARVQRRIMSQLLAKGKVSSIEAEKRVSTLGGIVTKAAMIAIITMSAMMTLEELGFDIKPILAGAGVLGLAVGFGAQNLVRDVISGLFLIVENRIRIGDVAVINGTGGLVEQINPRTTVLRSQDGTVHVFPNGTITTLANMTYDFSFYVFNISVAYKEDVDRVTEVLHEIGRELMQEDEYGSVILEPLEIMGMDEFADSAIVIKARIKTIPIKQWFVGREMNRRIKKRFDELNIEIPFPHRSFYFGEKSDPIRVKLEGSPFSREELKAVVAEVMREMGHSRTSLPRSEAGKAPGEGEQAE